jgi:hypothetical protein
VDDLRLQPCPRHRGLRLRHIDDGVFRTIYTLVVMEIGSRRILHVNSTEHPTAAWTTQQLREGFVPEHPWRYLEALRASRNASVFAL